MCRIAAKLVPCLLSKQQEICMNTCQGVQDRLERGPEFILKIIIDDETWVYECDPATKTHLSGRALSEVH